MKRFSSVVSLRAVAKQSHILLCIILFLMAFIFAGRSFATVTIGYTDQSWGFKIFSGAIGLFTPTLSNLNAADQSVAVLANNLNGTAVPATKANVVSTTKMAVLGHEPPFLLYPGNATSPFPSIWVKGATVNTATGASAPATYINGTDNNKYFQTGLTVQAVYAGANYQWTVYVYADKDILSQTVGPAAGRILDPRVSTLRWFSWQNDTNGTPKMPWGVRDIGAATASMFNIMPLISGATAAQIKAFLTGTTGASLPETAAGMSAVSGMAQASIPADGATYYNTDRNIQSSTNADNFLTSSHGRSQTGLVYASPSDNTCNRTEYVHIQLMAFWPKTIGVAPGAKSCTINIYQRTAN